MPDTDRAEYQTPGETGVPLHMDIPPNKMVCPRCGIKAGRTFCPTNNKAPWGEPIWHCDHCKIDMLVPPKPFCRFLNRLVTKFNCLNCSNAPSMPILNQEDTLIKPVTRACPHFVDNGVSKFLKLAKKSGFKKW